MIEKGSGSLAEGRVLAVENPEEFLSRQAKTIARARRHQDKLGAFTHWLDPEEPVVPDSRRPLAGFPAGLKANIAAQGAPTHCGSLLLQDYVSPFSATVVRRLRAAGARFIGVTAMDEFGMGSSSEHTRLGRPVNPWDATRTAGGSSGGSAAAVAAGHVRYALGSDTGGSVRQPAHCCGVVGLKPTWGRVSRFGLVAFASSLDTIGVLARGCADAWEVLRLMAGPDPLDATSQAQPALPPEPLIAREWRGVRCAVPADLETVEMDDAVRRRQKENEARLVSLGARLVPFSWRPWRDALAIYTVLSAAEAASNLQRYDGSLYGRRGAGVGHRESLVRGRAEGFGREVRRRILLGCHVLSEGYRGRYYLRARAGRQELTRAFAELFARADVLVCPTAPTAAFQLGSRLDDPLAMRRSDLFTIPASLAGLPALSLPTGRDERGLPLSLQLIAPRWQERELCGLALTLEAAWRGEEGKEAPWATP